MTEICGIFLGELLHNTGFLFLRVQFRPVHERLIQLRFRVSAPDSRYVPSACFGNVGKVRSGRLVADGIRGHVETMRHQGVAGEKLGDIAARGHAWPDDLTNPGESNTAYVAPQDVRIEPVAQTALWSDLACISSMPATETVSSGLANR